MSVVRSQQFVGAALFWPRRTPSERIAFLERLRRKFLGLCVFTVIKKVQTLESQFRMISGLRKAVEVVGVTGVGRDSIGVGTKGRALAGGRPGMARGGGKPCSYDEVA